MSINLLDTRYETLEESFAKDFLRKTKEEKNKRISHVISQTLSREEYAENVGYIRALTVQEETLQELLKAYFPRD